VGKVGSGKSSVVSALIGELEKQTDAAESSRMSVQGRVAYAPQQPWIQNATIRDNILFGLPYDEPRYNKCLTLCCLRADLEQLAPAGDLTEIGEKGINLSGGQKHRVSLARCLYSNADVYLFDDTLSAVDAHVSKSLFEAVIGPSGVLRHKTRVFVTNTLHFLDQVDQIVLLEDGRVAEAGSYAQLMSGSVRFRAFLSEHTKLVAEMTAKRQRHPKGTVLLFIFLLN
jgi:ABC-type multidrug transport system fused ATPase/permease subunit